MPPFVGVNFSTQEVRVLTTTISSPSTLGDIVIENRYLSVSKSCVISSYRGSIRRICRAAVTQEAKRPRNTATPMIAALSVIVSDATAILP